MSDIESNDGGDIPAGAGREDEQAEDQINGELNEVQETQNKSGEEDESEDDDEVPEDESVLSSAPCWISGMLLTVF